MSVFHRKPDPLAPLKWELIEHYKKRHPRNIKACVRKALGGEFKSLVQMTGDEIERVKAYMDAHPFVTQGDLFESGEST